MQKSPINDAAVCRIENCGQRVEIEGLCRDCWTEMHGQPVSARAELSALLADTIRRALPFCVCVVGVFCIVASVVVIALRILEWP